MAGKILQICNLCGKNKSYYEILEESYCTNCRRLTTNLAMSYQEFESLTREDKIGKIIDPKTKVLVLGEKHGSRYLKATTDSELENSCLKILSERLAYYEGDFFNLAKNEISNPSGNAFSLLKRRSSEGHEYEKIFIVEIEE